MGRILVSTPKLKYPITVFNLEGHKINEFGVWVNTSTILERIERNRRILNIDSNNNLICALVSEPLLEKYNSNGILLSRIDLSKLNCINERLNKVREQQTKINSNNDKKGFITVTLFNDLSIWGNKIYLSYSSQKEANLVEYNGIIVINNQKDALKPLYTFLLNPNDNNLKWYVSICATSKAIYASDAIYFKFIKFDIK